MTQNECPSQKTEAVLTTAAMTFPSTMFRGCDNGL